ncbi:unnamed protein product [Nezara viridula]|uniref:Uncharacterized protein n=1 Tax=Nezara viridula TaxID=85310 RepID=A0A9P0E8E9_NEZVI|nr:unnamed protein product [Nezara viridula]
MMFLMSDNCRRRLKKIFECKKTKLNHGLIKIFDFHFEEG